MRQVRARYENGALLPARPLPLKQGEDVSIVVLRRPDSARWNVDKLGAHPDEDQSLAEAGLADWADALDREDHR
ncbi:MAG: antitoxin family protein [Myxococcales bacterium]|nr:antitoxin family protein [Myxococcales bacterium]